MTKQERLMEYARCAVDITYFAKTYCKVWDKRIQKYVPFELLPQQVEVIEAYQANDKVLVAKYRQGGITTVTCLYLAHCLVYKKDIKIHVCANKLLLAKETFATIKNMLKNLPTDIFNRIPTDKDSQTHVKYNNGAELMALAASRDGVRGFTPDIIFIDEAAFLEEGVEFMKSANGTLSSGGQMLLISTPRGMDEVYYKTYKNAKLKKGDNNKYKVVEINWYNDPRYNEDLIWVFGDDFIEEKDPNNYASLLSMGYRPSSTWYRNMCGTMNNDPRTIAQELENKFLGSGGQLVDEKTIEKLDRECKEPLRVEFDSNMWIWEDKVDGYNYYLSCDVAKGTGDGDYTTIQIFKEDIQNFLLIQVAEFQGRIPLEVAAFLCYEYGSKYNNAYIIVDISGGWGITIVKYLTTKFYKNLHYDKPRENDVKVQMKDYMRGDKIPGFTMKSGAVRDYVIREFERRLREGEAIIYSSRLVDEIKTFVYIYSLKRYDHQRSAHDDLLMACAMLFSVYMLGKLNANETALYLQLAKSVVVKKGDDYLNEVGDMANSIQNGLNIMSNQNNDDWYTDRPKNKNINPYIFVR